MHYDFEDSEMDYITLKDDQEFSKALHYNFIIRGGVNQSGVVGSQQFPFYTLSAYVDKQITIKSALSLGVDAFVSKFLKEFIHYQSVAYPSPENDPNTDYKRLGVFVGYELIFNKISIFNQVGYYVYYPYEYEGRVYNRIGIKYRLSQKWFADLSLKSHAANAEAVAIGIGIHL